MLLFTKRKKKERKKKRVFFKNWLVISRNQHVEFFFPIQKFGINGQLPKSYFVLHAIKNGFVYASYRVQGVSGAVILNHMCIFFKFIKCHFGGVKEGRLI